MRDAVDAWFVRRTILSPLLIMAAACGDDPTPTTDLPPVVSAQQLTTAEDTSVDVALDVSDPEGYLQRVTVSSPAHGTITGIGNSWRYTPAADFHGQDAVTVTATDPWQSASATITFTVTPVNDAPVARTETFSADEDAPLSIEPAELLANDRDVDGDALSVVEVTALSRGSVTFSGGTIEFVPAADASGAAAFRYTVSDGTATATTDVVVDIGAINDAPRPGHDVTEMAEDSTIVFTPGALLDNDTDPDGPWLSITGAGDAAGGTVSFDGRDVQFTPTPDFEGDAAFTYTVSDGTASAMGEVTVHVNGVNDAPSLLPTTASTAYNTEVEIPLPATDIDGDSLVIVVVEGPAHGTVFPGQDKLLYRPGLDYVGDDLIRIQVSDGRLHSTIEDVAISVTE